MVGGPTAAAGRERVTEILTQTIDTLQQGIVQLQESRTAIDGPIVDIETKDKPPPITGIVSLAMEVRRLSQNLLKGLSEQRSIL